MIATSAKSQKWKKTKKHWCAAAFFSLAKVHQKEKLKWSDFGGINHQKWWENFIKIARLLYLIFSVQEKI